MAFLQEAPGTANMDEYRGAALLSVFGKWCVMSIMQIVQGWEQQNDGVRTFRDGLGTFGGLPGVSCSRVVAPTRA
eukprot:8264641-Pyramimonas_sp.AAC.2